MPRKTWRRVLAKRGVFSATDTVCYRVRVADLPQSATRGLLPTADAQQPGQRLGEAIERSRWPLRISATGLLPRAPSSGRHSAPFPVTFDP